MRKNLRTLTALLGSSLAVLVLAACASSSPAASGEQSVEYHADYPAYDSVDSLYKTADLVIEGRLTGTPQVRQLSPVVDVADPRLNPNAGVAGAAKAEPVVITVSTLTVTRVHKGAAKVGSTIEVKQLGGTYSGVTYRAEGVSAFRAQTPYLLFLATFADAPASLLNPEQGQYVLDAAGNPTRVSPNGIAVSAADLTRLSATG
jgi:predicted component of type VI protein secretion system